MYRRYVEIGTEPLHFLLYGWNSIFHSCLLSRVFVFLSVDCYSTSLKGGQKKKSATIPIRRTRERLFSFPSFSSSSPPPPLLTSSHPLSFFSTSFFSLSVSSSHTSFSSLLVLSFLSRSELSLTSAQRDTEVFFSFLHLFNRKQKKQRTRRSLSLALSSLHHPAQKRHLSASYLSISVALYLSVTDLSTYLLIVFPIYLELFYLYHYLS